MSELTWEAKLGQNTESELSHAVEVISAPKWQSQQTIGRNTNSRISQELEVKDASTVELELEIQGSKVTALVDTGSKISLLKKKWAK